MNLGQFSKSDWRHIAIGAALIVALAAGGVVWKVSAESVWASILGAGLGGLLTGALVVLLGSVNVKLNNLLRRVNETEASLQEMVNIRPLLDGPPLDYGGWAMDPHLGKTMAQLIARHEPRFVVECGSGTSTVFIAQCLKRKKTDGRVLALEHLDRFAEETRKMLRDHEVEEYGTVITAPLEQRDLEGRNQPWYGVDLAHFDQEPAIDLIVVDGPPATTGQWARYPALPLLRGYLADECVVLLDDGDRDEETAIAQNWARRFDLEATYVSGDTAAWILK